MTCCVWRPTEDAADASATRKSEFGIPFFIVLAVVVVVIVGLGKWVLWLYEQQRPDEARWVAIGLAVVFYGSMLLPVFLLRRRTKSDADVPLPVTPPGVFRGAVPVSVVLQSGNERRGGAQGWLWIERGQLVFKGDRFDFRLSREDFRSQRLLKGLLRNQRGYFLRLPPGISPVMMFFRPAFIVDGEAYRPMLAVERMRPDIEAWADGGPAELPSLFPPLRYPPRTKASSVPVRRWLPVAIGVGLLTAGFNLLFPGERGSNPLPIFFGGFAMIAFVFALPLLMERLMRKGIDKELEKVDRREHAKMGQDQVLK